MGQCDLPGHGIMPLGNYEKKKKFSEVHSEPYFSLYSFEKMGRFLPSLSMMVQQSVVFQQIFLDMMSLCSPCLTTNV